MDNWGDPWADNADDSKSPAKSKVTSPLPSTFAPAPALLNGFLDDAGWGNDDESFGDWSSGPPAKHVEDTVPAYTPAVDSFTTQKLETPSTDALWHVEENSDPVVVHRDDEWAGVTLDTHEDEDKVVSEPSDSSTTIQADDTAENTQKEASVLPQPDDDSSTRTSTSPSETSHNDAPAESPRTSYEEERGETKATKVEEEQDASQESSLVQKSTEGPESPSQTKEDCDVAEDTPRAHKITHSAGSVHSSEQDSAEISKESSIADDDASALSDRSRANTSSASTFAVDSASLGELFPSQNEKQDLEEAPDDPICSTSTRKAWYRLTRRQTMREYNYGNNDDNYIRVTWANSHIQSEVNKVIGRWAREDRLSGKGPGARASFYWDTSAPLDTKVGGTHRRQQSSQPITNVTSAEQRSIPLSAAGAAAFDWSSPSAPADPRNQTNVSSRSVSSPIAPIHPAVRTVQRQEARAVSVDLTSRKPGLSNHARSLTATAETPIVASLISPPISDTIASPFQPWTNNKSLDAGSATEENSPIAAAPIDDEDDWGDMVSTPTLPPPTTTPIAHTNAHNNTHSSATTTPQSIRSALISNESPDAMHASPIVRLRSTISPTAGPIGPGLLKSSKRSVSATTKKVVEKATPLPSKAQHQTATLLGPGDTEQQTSLDDPFAQQQPVLDIGVDNNREKPAPPVPSALNLNDFRPSTPPPHVPPPTSTIDSWADADFSFFESSLPPTTTTPPRDTLDPFSAFETPQQDRPTFTRSPPRKVTPPPVQPLTGATSAAQRRKIEEDAVIREILGGCRI
ncbi:hypothetical protein GQ44DRAFT_698397 [Phaeosphaeriaceae sp. PMI808]|nr:hypothetical protein GQ44DRAFT_698397 [Phaeosphaeriaceae sp. PMI808]